MLEFSDIQGIVLSGHAHLPHACFLFLQVQNPARAKAWLRGVIPQISTAARRAKGEPKPKSATHLAFSATGLSSLGLEAAAMGTFPREFTQGMGHGERTRVLGDTNNSAPEKWEVGGPNTPDIHVLLAVYATSEAELKSAVAESWSGETEAAGLKEIFRQESFKRGVNEPFGFRDGISQPAIEGAAGEVLPGQSIIKAGEFLLGYVNEYGEEPPMPSVATAQDSRNLLPAASSQPGRKELGRNATYFIWRKLSQDVDGFWKFMGDQTKNADGSANKEKQIYLGSKMVGRWPSGAPLVLSPKQDDPALGADPRRNNKFDFMTTDAAGTGCPIGSHMRRANPRDMLPPNPQKSQEVSNRHRLLRRGRPFEEMQNGQKIGQGILFMAINADIQRQFEFIQQTWLNSPKFGGLCDNKDPIVSDNDGTGVMVLQDQPVRQRIQGMSRFVETKGGGYFFMPGIKALQFLAA